MSVEEDYCGACCCAITRLAPLQKFPGSQLPFWDRRAPRPEALCGSLRPLSLAGAMPSVTIAGYKGVAPNEGTSALGASSVGTLTFWMATLNLLSHYFGGAACPPSPTPVTWG